MVTCILSFRKASKKVPERLRPPQSRASSALFVALPKPVTAGAIADAKTSDLFRKICGPNAPSDEACFLG